MAQRIASLPERVQHPWEEWADGSVWRIRQGEDFHCTVVGMRSQIFGYAYRSGLTVATSIPEDGAIDFQFRPDTSLAA